MYCDTTVKGVYGNVKNADQITMQNFTFCVLYIPCAVVQYGTEQDSYSNILFVPAYMYNR